MPESGLERRPLGGTGLSVSALGMGCAKLGAFWQGRSPAEGRRALDAARHAGIDFFDTADCYARGLSERLLGRCLAGHEAVVCTKVGLLKTPLALASARRSGGRDLALSGLARGGAAAGCFAPRYVRLALERSLRRLRRDHVEVLLLHAPPLDAIRSMDFLPALDGLVQAGKVLHFGLSCAGEAEADAALAVPGLECIQIPFSAARPALLEHVRPSAAALGVAITAAGPFGDSALLDAGRDPGELLRVALAEPGVASVVAGMSRESHVEANVGAATARLPAGA